MTEPPAAPHRQEIPEGGSLFDLEAPAAPEPATDDDEPDPAKDEEVSTPSTEADETPAASDTNVPDGAALSAAATFSDDPEPAAGSTPEPEKAAPAAEEQDEEPKQEARPSGAAHQPKTDAEIPESGSLFDL